MPKRSASSKPTQPMELPPQKKKKQKKKVSPGTLPESALDFLVGPDVSFLSNHFESKPLHVRRNDPTYYDRLGVSPGSLISLYSDSRLLELLREHGPLEQEKRMQVLRTTEEGGRESADPPPDGLASAEWVAARLREGYTIQHFQPQTFCSRIHRLLAALEAELGCLCGCSAYLTPAGKHALAPHHDDVEVWVLQT